MKTRLRVWKGEQEISDDLKLVPEGALPGGWSQYELCYVAKDAEGHPSAPEHVGWIESGYLSDCAERFHYIVEAV